MRVLVTTRQGAGHIGPLIPFAHAARIAELPPVDTATAMSHPVA